MLRDRGAGADDFPGVKGEVLVFVLLKDGLSRRYTRRHARDDTEVRGVPRGRLAPLRR